MQGEEKEREFKISNIPQRETIQNLAQRVVSAVRIRQPAKDPRRGEEVALLVQPDGLLDVLVDLLGRHGAAAAPGRRPRGGPGRADGAGGPTPHELALPGQHHGAALPLRLVLRVAADLDLGQVGGHVL